MILTNCFWSRCFVSYLYSFVVYLYVNGDGSIASVGEGRAVCLCPFALRCCQRPCSVVLTPLQGGTGGNIGPVFAWCRSSSCWGASFKRPMVHPF